MATERDWPYDDDHIHEDPSTVDLIAKRLRTLCYFRVHDLDELRACLAAYHPVSVSFSVTADWFSADQGRIPYPRKEATELGMHSVCVYSYDDSRQELGFANSWGTRWGNEGYGTIPYAYFREFSFEAWAVEARESGEIVLADDPSPLRNWGFETPVGRVHGVELYDATVDERIAWALLMERHGFADLYEFFVRPNWRRQQRAGTLAARVLEIASWLNAPVRVWVPCVDDRLNESGVDAVARLLGVELVGAGVPWASRSGLRPVRRRPPERLHGRRGDFLLHWALG